MMDRRRALVVLAVAGLMALVFGLGDRSTPIETGARVAVTDSMARGVSEMSAALPKETGKALLPTSKVVNPQAPQPPPLPFSFLGRITEGGETSILLYAGGRTLKVRSTGPLDDQYEVDAIHDDHLVLRYVPLGARQVLALASRQYLIPGDTAADTPQD